MIVDVRAKPPKRMKKSILFYLLVFYSLFNKAQLTFTIITGNGSTINCVTPTLNMMASTNFTGTVSYTWASPGATLSGSSVSITSAGSYTVSAVSGTLSAMQVISVTINTAVPVAATGSTFMVNSATALTLTVISPTNNITQMIFPPGGGTVTGNSNPFIYVPGTFGLYTYCVRNDDNGCATCQGTGGPYVPGAPGTFAGLHENTQLNFELWPNPSKENLKIKGADLLEKEVIIISSLGQQVFSAKFETTEMNIDVRAYPRGLYFVKVAGNDGKSIKRLILD
jgi:hypothetical protein